MKHLRLFESFNDMKVIHVNIWDDYKQIPEYDVNDDTTMYIEEGDKLNIEENNSAINRVFDYINSNIKIDNVIFLMEERNGYNRITIQNLCTEDREALLKMLKTSKLEYNNIPYKFYSES